MDSLSRLSVADLPPLQFGSPEHLNALGKGNASFIVPEGRQIVAGCEAQRNLRILSHKSKRPEGAQQSTLMHHNYNSACINFDSSPATVGGDESRNFLRVIGLALP